MREIFEFLKEKIKDGISTKYLDDLVCERIKKAKAESAFLGYNGFPGNSCISINEEVVHGIPDDRRFLHRGDIVSVDIGVRYKGYIADSTMTYAVGSVSEKVTRLMEVTYNSLYEGIKQSVAGKRVGDISSAIQTCVESNDLSVVRDFVGHGVGKELHEDPQVPNYGEPDTGPRLKEGMVIAIEPMVIIGDYKVIVKENNWTVCSADQTWAAHYEHTIAITANGPKILTI